MRMGLLSMVCVVAAATPAAFAQVDPQRAATLQPRLRGVEQMVDDISPIGVSLRSFQTDLRQPSGFESVYRLPGEGGEGDRLGRIDGALVATFPQSVYAPLYVRERFMFFFSRERKIGYVPQVPAGTVFRIGPDLAAPLVKPDGPRLSQPESLVAQQPAAQRVETVSMAAVPFVRTGAEGRAKPHAAAAVKNAAKSREPEETDDSLGDAPIAEDRVRDLMRRAVDRERQMAGR